MKKLKSLSLVILSLLIFSLPLCACGHKGNLDKIFKQSNYLVVMNGFQSSNLGFITDSDEIKSITKYFIGIDYIDTEETSVDGCVVAFHIDNSLIARAVTESDGTAFITVYLDDESEKLYKSDPDAINFSELSELLTYYQYLR